VAINIPHQADMIGAPSMRGGTEAAIRHHYDLSNAFYALWLDATLTYSCAMWNEGDDLTDLLSAQRRKLDYHLDAATTLLPPVLSEFCRLYPDIRLQLTTSNDPVALLKHDCELALHGGRAPDADVVCRRVLTYQRRLCASPAYMSGRVPLANVADLAAHNCITHVHGERTAWSFEHNGLITTQPIEPYIECDNFQSIVQLVHAGLGIGRLAEALVGPEVQKGTLIDILPGYRCVYPDGGVAGTWLLFANRRILFRTRLLADFVARTLGGN
jgi:DNA-binding transcriptional LysR family regulator